MDLFMDKLSQKTTAQEIIKANTAADVEELNKWKKQAADYSECLTKMHKLVDEGLTKLACSQVETVALGDLVEENAEGIKMLQRDTDSLKMLLEQLQEQVDSMGSSMAGQLEAVSQAMEQKKTAQPSAELLERLDVMEENVHKECVKVYRNVQAVMVEESGKQSADLERTKSHVKGMKKKVTAILVIAGLGMAFGLAGLVIQVLSMLNILVF
ncbi:MAG TPA: hypothetical protein DCZ91_21335 [Lachnospiraceae bacterium]|nr:hypothetical protein [Lachnospiraceae bacterium]